MGQYRSVISFLSVNSKEIDSIPFFSYFSDHNGRQIMGLSLNREDQKWSKNYLHV